MSKSFMNRMIRAFLWSAIPLTVVVIYLVWCVDTLASRQWDAEAWMLGAERMHRVDGIIYKDYAEQKGPLIAFIYYLVFTLGHTSKSWQWVSALIILIAGGTAFLGARLVLLIRPSPSKLLVASGSLAFFYYLITCGEEFSYVLYSRNLVSLLTLLSLFCLWKFLLHSRKRLYLILAGGFLGQMVLLMPTSILTAGGIFMTFLAFRFFAPNLTASLEDSMRRKISSAAILVGVMLISFFLPFFYYRSMGAFDDFWAQWFQHNLAYSEATGLGMTTKIQKVVLDLSGYFVEHPLLLAVLLLWLLVVIKWFRSFAHGERIFMIGLGLWLFAEILSMALSQRFFGHYLILIVVPIGIMFLTLLNILSSRFEEVDWRLALSAVMMPLLVLAIFGSHHLQLGFLFSPYGPFSESPQLHREILFFQQDQKLRFSLFPYRKMMPAKSIIQAFTNPDDFIYVWSTTPQRHAYFERPVASRYIESRWITGVVYGDVEERKKGWDLNVTYQDEKYSLPDVLQKWEEDTRKTPPKAMVIFSSDSLPLNSSLQQTLSRNYTEVFRTEDYQVYLLLDHWRQFKTLLQNSRSVWSKQSIETPMEVENAAEMLLIKGSLNPEVHLIPGWIQLTHPKTSGGFFLDSGKLQTFKTVLGEQIQIHSQKIHGNSKNLNSSYTPFFLVHRHGSIVFLLGDEVKTGISSMQIPFRIGFEKAPSQPSAFGEDLSWLRIK